ncbi:hypothetical protein [Streptomyces sp. NBC_01439]|nr:hypothetical protein [Streptomyces sp. NBC_01439]
MPHDPPEHRTAAGSPGPPEHPTARPPDKFGKERVARSHPRNQD